MDSQSKKISNRMTANNTRDDLSASEGILGHAALCYNTESDRISHSCVAKSNHP